MDWLGGSGSFLGVRASVFGRPSESPNAEGGRCNRLSSDLNPMGSLEIVYGGRYCITYWCCGILRDLILL